MSDDSSLSSESTSKLSAENFSVIFVGIIVLILVFVGTTSGRDTQRKNKLRSLPRLELPLSATIIKPRGRDLICTETESMQKAIEKMSAPTPLAKSDPSNDPCFGWGDYGSSYELVHYKHVAAAAASLLKDSFESIRMPIPPGCTLRKHLWDVQAQYALPAEIVGSILATYERCRFSSCELRQVEFDSFIDQMTTIRTTLMHVGNRNGGSSAHVASHNPRSLSSARL